MTRLLVLRPELGAAATVERARALGLEACAAPLFTIAPLAWDAPDPRAHDALMLTSAQALRHAGDALGLYRALPAYAVGEASAAAARAAGFGAVHAGPSDADALLADMARAGITRPLHLAGREHIAAAHPALTITRRIVYAAEPVAALPLTARDALAAGAVALLHSPRAAAVFARLADQAGLAREPLAIACLSPAVAAAAGGGWRTVAIADRPREPALLAAAAAIATHDAPGRLRIDAEEGTA